MDGRAPLRIGRRWRPRHAPAAGIGALALGALACGALAIGALALGRLAIGRMAVRRARFDDLEIDRLTVRSLQILEPGGGSGPRGPARTAPTARRR